MIDPHGKELKSYNDVVYAVALRARELGDMKMPELRLTNGYDCDTNGQAHEKDAGKSRGQIIEEILTEEFVSDFDVDLEDT